MSSIVDRWWAVRSNPAESVLKSALHHFSNEGIGILHNKPIGFAWAVEHKENFARAWKHSSDPKTMISLAARVMSERKYTLVCVEIARLVLPYTRDPRVIAGIKATDGWAKGNDSLLSVKGWNVEINRANHEAADYSPEKWAAGAIYWLTSIPREKDRIDVGGFEGRMLVNTVRETVEIGRDFYPEYKNDGKKIDAKMASIIRRSLNLSVSDLVSASLR